MVYITTLYYTYTIDGTPPYGIWHTEIHYHPKKFSPASFWFLTKKARGIKTVKKVESNDDPPSNLW